MADILKKLGEDKEKSMALEDAFKSCRHPDSLSMSFLAADIGVTQEEIENWFAARLTKWRKEEGFVPIAERAAILAQNINKKAK
ncbi:homeodomain-only protein-like isoform X2 [Orbicella faveolata]|uniref:homeodomain-only protein-like isoform X1 n=1 Tax=Orbicella faveolata TaxID=48498 RepID=UPI0009E43DE5|nr:homeodomain-only protein-like isoform X1 [Orbicella faveolata]XP_020624475.1 homeodomain-only protein-like isoform X2 [Orbicella faveolata]